LQHQQSVKDAFEKQEEAEAKFDFINKNKEKNERNIRILVKEVIFPDYILLMPWKD